KAEAQRFAAEQAAAAALYRSEQESEAERIQRAKAAEAVELEAAADAKRARDVGLAEAEAIQAKGEAEALARQKLAEALRQYSDAGLSIEALKVLPDVIAAAAEPLSRAGKTTIISNGNGAGGTGAAKLTRDVTEVLTTTVPVVKELAGIDLADLLRGALAKATGTEAAEEPEDA
ncbi:MAG TPA: flotillin domain-containing protein, partial [Nitriliruptorales bacterium]